ncbi:MULTISPECIES: hypothetical protein [Burkholderia]|uniref:hypothetical protein n=1 Tax=Burkholderia TaxID=32008 RepID=UPI000AA88770|nr:MULTISPECIES: hypothetical protein [Burkholderia]
MNIHLVALDRDAVREATASPTDEARVPYERARHASRFETARCNARAAPLLLRHAATFLLSAGIRQ